MKKLLLLALSIFIVLTTYAKFESSSIVSKKLKSNTSSNSNSKRSTSISRLAIKTKSAAVLSPTPSVNNILYVKKDATGNGSSWANAIGELGDALKWAKDNEATWTNSNPLQIWVAKGVYKPMYSPEDGVNYGRAHGRANAFLMVKDVKIYGNFSGTESDLADRDLANTANKTTLSGDLNNNDGANFAYIFDNSYNVVVSLGDVSAALIDGFTITGGYANQSYLVFINNFYTARNIGAGILVDGSSPRLRNLIIEKNKATDDGVLSLKYSSSVLENVTIQNNAARNGAGVYIQSSVINFNNIVIRNNKATKNGGAIHIGMSSKLKIVNGLIVNNSAMRGGGISSLASSSSLTNVTMSNNTTSFEGGGIYNTANSNTEVRNSIIFGNKKGVNWSNIVNDSSGDTADSKYSLVQGETTSPYTDAANQNLVATTDPLFNDAATDDYTLKPSSPVIGKGSNSLYIGALATDNDLAGNPRLKGANIDMGAYEDTTNQFTPTLGVLYVNKTVIGGDGTGSSWANAIPELADALLWANVKSTAWTTANPLNIYVAKGTYKPMYSPEDGVNFGSNKGRDNTFLMVNNVKLYGGFIGTETAITNRVLTVNGIGNGTILSGDLNGDDIYDANGRPIGVTNEDNAYHVIVAANNTTAVITEIDGFEIKGGNADGNSFINVKALAVRRYYGGAIYSFSNAIFFNGVSTVNLTNSSLSGNSAFSSASSTASGGAIYSRSTSAASTVSLTNSNLSGNSAFSSASFAYGGGIYSYSNSTSSIVSLINSSVSGNTASSSSFSFGGGIYSSSSNAASTVSLTNSSLSDNTASNGGGICSYANSAALNDVKLVNSTMAANNGVSFILFSNGIKSFKAHNTLVYGNQGAIELTDPNSGSSMGSAGAITKDIQYSLVQGEGNTANGNLDGSYTNNILTNLFNDATNRDYSLKIGSPAIGSGNNSLYTGTLSTDKDLSGNPRLKGTNIDMGAYENQALVVLPVNFGQFAATSQSNRVKLDWNTFSETNNSSFIVYRSTDGLSYTQIIIQTSKGGNANSYSNFDNSPVNGLNYYRLSQKDNDGTVTKLADAVVNFSLANAEVKAWPNPVTNILNVSFTAGKFQTLRLVDITGKKLLERNIAATQIQLEIDMSTYPKGIYMVELKGSHGSDLVKVIK